MFVIADIVMVEECEKIIKSGVDIFGRADVLFNLTGTQVVKSMHQYTEEDYERIVDVNIKGSLFASAMFFEK